MKINKILTDMLIFFKKLRGSGTTSLIAKIAKENDVWVIVNTIDEGFQFGDKAIPLDRLKDRAYGFDSKPILIDNHVLLILLEGSLNKIDEQEEAIKTRSELIRTVKNAIRNFERSEGINLDLKESIEFPVFKRY